MDKMIREKHCCQIFAASALVIGLIAQSVQATETQGYVVSAFHTATYSHEDNCPGGGNGGQNEVNQRGLEYIGYSPEEARAALLNVDSFEQSDVGEDGESPLLMQVMYRGKMNGKTITSNSYPAPMPSGSTSTAWAPIRRVDLKILKRARKASITSYSGQWDAF